MAELYDNREFEARHLGDQIRVPPWADEFPEWRIRASREGSPPEPEPIYGLSPIRKAWRDHWREQERRRVIAELQRPLA